MIDHLTTMIMSPPILISLLTIALLATLTYPARLIHIRCETTQYYSNYYSKEYNSRNNSFESTINQVLNSLTINTPETGFHLTTAGELSHQVYGLGQCNGDISNESCTGCLITASQSLLQGCHHDNGAVAFFDQCTLRYSFDNFFFQLGTKKQYWVECFDVGCANQNLVKQQITTMFKLLSQIAAFNDSVRRSATGVNTQGHKVAQVYGMVQCTRDLSKNQCYECLRQSLELSSPCLGSLESVGGSLSCVVVTSRSKFFDSDLSWVPPPDPDLMEL